MVKEREEKDIWIVRFAPLYRNIGIAIAALSLMLLPFVPYEWGLNLFGCVGLGALAVTSWWIYTHF